MSMSLRFRLNLLVSVLSLAILALGTALVIHNARQAVFEEIQSTANLTLQLLELAAMEADDDAALETRSRLLARLEALEIRHLHIVLADRGSETLLAGTVSEVDRAAAPAWFTHLVEPPRMEFRRARAPCSAISVAP